MKLTLDRIIGILGLIITIVGLNIMGSYDIIISSTILASGLIMIIYSIDDILDKRRDSYRHMIISYEYNLNDSKGKKADFKISHFLKVKKKKIPIGGGGFDCYPYQFNAFMVFTKSDLPPLENKTSVNYSNPKKASGFYNWEYYFNPPLKRGQKFWLIETFKVKNVFTYKTESNCFYAMREIDKFKWKVNFPIERPCKRWWVTTDYIKNQPDGKVIMESYEKTNTINFELKKLKRGHYYLHWEW
jgi:hypothetical protein